MMFTLRLAMAKMHLDENSPAHDVCPDITSYFNAYNPTSLDKSLYYSHL